MSRSAVAKRLFAAANPPASGLGPAPLDGTVVLRQLLALAAAIIMARVLGLAFRRWRQPPVIGEIIAGILLGPSVLGWISPQALSFLFPPEAIAFLNIIATLGVVLYMFLAGLELEPKLLRRQTMATAAIAQFGVLVPFVAGLLLAALVLPGLPSGQPTPLYFRFFLGPRWR